MGDSAETSTSSTVPRARAATSHAASSSLMAAIELLDELWNMEEEASQTRSQKRSTKKGPPSELSTLACGPCRKLKARCYPSLDRGRTCLRCSTLEVKCVWPARQQRGPKRKSSRKQQMLEEAKNRIMAVAIGEIHEENKEQGGLGYDDSDDDGGGMEEEEQEQEQKLITILKNPLLTLTLAKDEHHRRSGSGFVPSYCGDGLYQTRPEFDFSVDPVDLGILSFTDLERLVDLYFTKLRPFLWHLDPTLHTATFLRNNSPFLTSALAATAASFDPQSSVFALKISQHARHLAVKAFADGLKSVEVVQAFVFLAHWSQPESSWAEDRSWAWQGEAIRIATEIRMDLPIDLRSLGWYRTTTLLTEEDLPRFQVSRERSWSLLFAGEIAMCIQTGRMEAILGLSLPGGLKAVAPATTPDSPDYNYLANEACNRIFARALNLWAGLREEPDSYDLRQSFVSFWKPAMDAWRSRWPAVNPFIDVFAENIGIILNLVSLRLKGGSAQSILTECRAAAIRTLQKVTSWKDQSTQLAYSSNFVIINIAYGAVLLLQLSYYFEQTATPELEARCLNVAAKLEWIGTQRPNGLSIATVHAARVRSLIHILRNQHTPIGVDAKPTSEPVTTSFSSAASTEDPFVGHDWTLGTGWPDSFSSAALDFLDSTMYDPMLGFLWGDTDGAPLVPGTPSIFVGPPVET